MGAHVIRHKKRSINALKLEASCYLAALGDNLYNNIVYGSCSSSLNESLYERLQLLLYAVDGNCLTDVQKDKFGSYISSIIGVCKPKKERTKCFITLNPDYTEWYASQMYLDCLTYYINQGCVVDPMIDLAADLDVVIDVNAICDAIVIILEANDVPCDVVASINIVQICTDIAAEIIANNTCSVDENIVALDTCIINAVVNSIIN